MTEKVNDKSNHDPAFIIEYDQEKKMRIRLDSPKKLQQKIGEETFNTFMGCFAGIDRISMLSDMSELNNNAHKEDSALYERNFLSIWLLICGTYCELSVGIQKLAKSGVKGKVKDNSSWLELNKINNAIQSNQFIQAIRNKAVHFCDTEIYSEGMKTMREEKHDFILFQTESSGKIG
jgi:hypothetical protein